MRVYDAESGEQIGVGELVRSGQFWAGRLLMRVSETGVQSFLSGEARLLLVAEDGSEHGCQVVGYKRAFKHVAVERGVGVMTLVVEDVQLG